MAFAEAFVAYPWIRFSKPPVLRYVCVAHLLRLTGDPNDDLTLKNVQNAQIGPSTWMQRMSAGEARNAQEWMESQHIPAAGRYRD